MANEIRVFNNSGMKFLPLKQVKEIVNITLEHNKIKNASVNVIYVGDREIWELNKSFLKHNRPTDVITFTLEESPIEGEIYLSIDTAAKQASEYGVTIKDEILRLACHGALHLAGFDDSTDELRKEMNDMETKFITMNKSK